MYLTKQNMLPQPEPAGDGLKNRGILEMSRCDSNYDFPMPHLFVLYPSNNAIYHR